MLFHSNLYHRLERSYFDHWNVSTHLFRFFLTIIASFMTVFILRVLHEYTLKTILTQVFWLCLREANFLNQLFWLCSWDFKRMSCEKLWWMTRFSRRKSEIYSFYLIFPNTVHTVDSPQLLHFFSYHIPHDERCEVRHYWVYGVRVYAKLRRNALP